MQLPTKITKATVQEPRLMVLFAHTKCGKTSNLAKLPNALIVDLEDGASYYDCMSINIKQESLKENVNPLKLLMSLPAMIKKANQDNDGVPVYDFIILDTTSALEDMATELALFRYKQTPIGKNYAENSILKLPNGAGHFWIRQAFEELYDGFKGLAKKCLILSAHVKSANINKKGVDLVAKDINLTGKLKQIVCSQADSIGYLYRDSKTKSNVISFLNDELDLASGARQDYLTGREITLSKKEENGELTTYWEEIFPSIKQK